MRCERHGLAAGPSGQCVVCLRELRERATRRAVFWGSSFIAATLVASLVLLTPRLLRSRWSIRRETLVMNFAARAAEGHADAGAGPNQASAAPFESAEVVASAAASSAPLPAASAAVNAANSADAAAEGVPAPSAEQVRAAVQATPVLMFSAGWCPACAKARAFFHDNGIGVTDRDVDADPQANAELKRRSGGKAIPLIAVDGVQLEPGFSEQATLAAVMASVQRRLGVPGLKLVATPLPDAAK